MNEKGYGMLVVGVVLAVSLLGNVLLWYRYGSGFWSSGPPGSIGSGVVGQSGGDTLGFTGEQSDAYKRIEELEHAIEFQSRELEYARERIDTAKGIIERCQAITNENAGSIDRAVAIIKELRKAFTQLEDCLLDNDAVDSGW
jgi:hypothetical protein